MTPLLPLLQKRFYFMTPFFQKRLYFLIAFNLLIACVSILYTLSIFDFGFIFGSNAYWKEPFADRITNIIGSLYFAKDSWRFPLFFVPHLSYPEGTNIIYTDSIPLLAFIDKVIYKISGHWFNYFGFWIFSCYIFLAFATTSVFKLARCTDPKIIIGGVLLILCCPALLIRFGHAGLMAHFLIVWSFYLYLKVVKNSYSTNITLQFGIISALTILLQTYFLLMIMPFFAASLLFAMKNKSLSIKNAPLTFAFVLCCIVMTAFISGLIGSHSPSAAMIGFGLYSMNLLSPILPSKEHLPHFISKHVAWDGNGYLWDATGGQYEGYNYLGAGIIFLLVVHLFYSRDYLIYLCKRHFFLILGLLGLCLLALSNKIYLGNWLILDLHIKTNILSYFRTSGRLFWPIYYVLGIALTIMTVRIFSPRSATTLIMIAVMLQLIDTHPLRKNTHHAQSVGVSQTLSKTIWQPLLKEHIALEQYPSFQCGGWASDWPQNNSNMELLLMAAQNNTPTNSAYLARTSRNCDQERVMGSNVPIEKDKLYIFANDFPVHSLNASQHFKDWCRHFKFGLVCSQKFSSNSALVALSEFTLPKMTPIPHYKTGEVLHFTTKGNGEPFLFRGWYGAETWGTWTANKNAEILLHTLLTPKHNYRLTVYARGFVHPKHPEKEINVYVNGIKLALWKYKLGEEVVSNSVVIPKKLISQSKMFKINFVSNEIESPKQVGLSEDTKQISLGLIELSLTPI